MYQQTSHNEDLITRLRKRAEIRRQIPTRKSVQEGKPDKLADLLEEAALALETMAFLEVGEVIEDYDGYPWKRLTYRYDSDIAHLPLKTKLYVLK